MFHLHLAGYTYDANSPFDMDIGGYWYNVGPAFYNYGVTNHGSLRPAVTLASLGGNMAVILGGVGTSSGNIRISTSASSPRATAP